MLENDTHQVYGDGYDLPDILEIHRLGLLKNDFFLLTEVDKPNLNLGAAVAVGHLAEEYELVVAHGVSGGVDGLNNVDYAGHS